MGDGVLIRDPSMNFDLGIAGLDFVLLGSVMVICLSYLAWAVAMVS